MPAISTKLHSTTTFDLREFSGAHNGYNPAMQHPSSDEIIIISADGTKRSLFVSQLESFLSYAESYPNMGKALDAVAVGMPPILHAVR